MFVRCCLNHGCWLAAGSVSAEEDLTREALACGIQEMTGCLKRPRHNVSHDQEVL